MIIIQLKDDMSNLAVLKTGAASRNRTEDPIITNDVLYQLS